MEEGSTYRVVFNGNISTDINIDTVKEKVALIFNTGINDIENLFNGEKHIIKQNISHDEAKNIEKAFLEAGAICYVENFNKNKKFKLNLDDVDKEMSTSNINSNGKVLTKGPFSAQCRHCNKILPYDASSCPDCSSSDPFSKKAIEDLTQKMKKQKTKIYGTIIGFFLSAFLLTGWGMLGWLIIIAFGAGGILFLLEYYVSDRKDLYVLFQHTKDAAIGDEAKKLADKIISQSRKKLGFDVVYFDMDEEKKE